MFRFRTIVEDYEARLTISDSTRTGTSANGKAEWERYGNGGTEFTVRIRNIDLPEDSILNIYLDDRFAGRITVRNRRGELRIDSTMNGTVPRAVAGTQITVLNGTVLVLKGLFVKD